MNTPNPLVPQGSLQEQSQKKSQIRLIVFSIAGLHVLVLLIFLAVGCKREEPYVPPAPPLPPVDTNPPTPPPPPTNYTPPAPATNVSYVPPTPPTPTLPEATPPAAATEHVIAKGDTFGSLAKKFGVSIKAIQQANPGVDSTRLKIGQKITIPPKPPGGAEAPRATAPGATAELTPAAESSIEYTVKKGDNLTSIAKANHTTAKAIKAANNMKTDMIQAGKKLKIPAHAAAAPAPAAPPASATMPPMAPPPSFTPPTAPTTPTTPPPAGPVPSSP